jgi:hypothetical protein
VREGGREGLSAGPSSVASLPDPPTPRPPPMNALLLVALVLGLLAVAGAVLAALLGKRPARARRVALVAGGAAALYAVALAGVNAGSAPRLLEVGAREAFCGVYLDCHVGLSVEGVTRVEAAGRAVHVVALRLSSDARQATLYPSPLTLHVEDAAGRRFARDPAAEAALGLRPDLAAPLAAGASRRVRGAFVLPEGARASRLRVGLGDPVQRVAEALLIGDANGLLHAPVAHALE